VQFGFAHPLGVAIRRRFYLPLENGSNHLHHGVTIGINDDLSYSSDDNNKKMPIQAQHIGKSPLWQYGLWSFQTGDTKLERFLPHNKHTQRKLLNFKFWINGELSKRAKI
jgi:hypothetical protein